MKIILFMLALIFSISSLICLICGGFIGFFVDGLIAILLWNWYGKNQKKTQK